MYKQVKVCEKCNSVNEESAFFCRICGAPLGQPVGANTNQPEPQQSFAYQQSGYNPNTNEIYGVPLNEMALFVGENAEKFIPKFIKKATKNRKAGFNVLMFVLGLLFSPIVASFWFFHRKLNKIGTLILALGVVLFAAETACIVPIVEKSLNITEIVYSAVDQEQFFYEYSDNMDFYDLQELLSDQQMRQVQKLSLDISRYTGITSLLNLASLAIVIVITIFADWWYLKFCVEKTKRIKQNEFYTFEDIMAAGGTKSIIWIILLIAFIIASVGVGMWIMDMAMTFAVNLILA